MGEVRYLRIKVELDTKEAAEYLSVKPSTLYKWCEGGLGPRHIKRFGRLRFRAEDLDAFMKANTEVRKAYS